MKRLIHALCIAGTLTGCASQATLAPLHYAQNLCAINPTINAEACASIPVLQAEANAEANQNTLGAVAVIALLPLYIMVAALGASADSGPHYHHHYYRHR